MTQGQAGLGSFFSVNKRNYPLITAFCIHSGYLCLMLKFVL